MHKPVLKESNFGATESVFVKRPPAKAAAVNSGSSPLYQPATSGTQEAQILCKRIDNSVHNVNLKGDLPLNQKFVPLAIPVETFKKKPGHSAGHSKIEAPGQENQKTTHTMSHSMPHSRFHSRQQSMPQSIAMQSMPVSHNTSGYNLNFNAHDVSQHEPRGSGGSGIKPHRYHPSFDEEAYKSGSATADSNTLMNKILDRPTVKKSETKSPNKVMKKAVSTDKHLKAKSGVEAAGKSKKEGVMKKPPIPTTSSPKKSPKKSVKKEEERGERRTRKGIEESNTKSGKGSKVGSPNRTEGSNQKRRIKKREHVSKSEIPPALEEMIQRNAHEYIEELRAKKHISELEKRLHEERKAALEEGNKMIRVANMQRFNAMKKNQQPKFAWGVDQRKFQEGRGSHERHSSMGMQQKAKIDDKERRKMLGLDQFDEETLHELQVRAKREQELRQRETSAEANKPKKLMFDEEERLRIHEYMIQKRIKIEQEQHYKEAGAYEDLERKRHNLEKLFRDIRYSRERDAQQQKVTKPKKKLRKRKGGLRHGERTTQGFYRDAENRRHDVTEEDVDDENYSALYHEYKRIIDTKKNIADASGHARQVSNLENYEGEDVEDSRERRSKKRTGNSEESKQNVQQRKDEITQKYLALSNRYQNQKNLASNLEAIDENFQHNKSSKKSSPGKKGSGKKRKEGHRGHGGGYSPYEHDKKEAQDVIMEMETDNFSDNDYLKSERMMIRDKYSKDRMEDRGEGESDDKVYDSEGNLPEESAREIIEAAAIFIQKNYRGYRTRKLLKMYFDQIYRQGLDSDYEEREEEVEEEEEEEQQEKDYIYESDQRGKQEKQQQHHHQHQNQQQHEGYDYRKSSGGNEAKRSEEYDEEEPEGLEGEDEADFLDENEKKSIMHLLQKQKKQMESGGSRKQQKKQEYEQEEEEDDLEAEDMDEDEEELVYGHHKHGEPRVSYPISQKSQKSHGSSEKKKKEEYSGSKERQSAQSSQHKGYLAAEQKFQKESGRSGDSVEEDEEQLRELEGEEYGEEYEGEEEEYDEEEARRIQYQLQQQRGLPAAEEDEEEFGKIQVIRRTKSDGELLDNHRFGFDYDDMEDSDQISLHDDGENFMQGNYQEHGAKFGLGGKQQGYMRGINMREGKLELDEDEVDLEGEKGEDLEDEYQQEEGEEEELPLESGEYEGQEGDYEYEEGYGHGSLHRNQYGLQHQDSDQLNKIPTIASLSVGTKNVMESQVVLNANTSKEMLVAKVRTESIFASNKEALANSEILDSDMRRSYEVSEPEPHGEEGQVASSKESESERRPVNVLKGKEGQNFSKSSVTVEMFNDEDKKVPTGLVESAEKKEMVKSASDDFREQLIHELKVLGHDKSDKRVEKSFEKRNEEEKKEDVTNSAAKSRSSHTQSTETLSVGPGAQSGIRQNDPVLIQMTSHYQQELARLREEQAKKWTDVITQLDKLTHQGDKELSINARQFVENLAKQSEINKKLLLESTESTAGLKSAVSEEKSLMNEIDTLRKKQPHFSVADVPLLTSDVSQPSLKKGEALSPSEGKVQKKKKPFEFGKKPNLEIDVSNMNEENNEAAAALNLELSQMRLALGSEQLVREQSARTLTHSLSTPTELELIDLNTPENIEGLVSIFERDPFKEFTHKKFKELMSHESMKEVINMREKALEMRHKTQMDSMKKMLETRKFSPRTFQNKSQELEKWVSKERENIQKSKKDIEKGWNSTAESLKRTQRDLQFLQKVVAPNKEGRGSASDISLRHSFVDEENSAERGEHGELGTEKYNVRSSLNLGTEIKSPTSSKNIKIIDKFELKDGPEGEVVIGEEKGAEVPHEPAVEDVEDKSLEFTLNRAELRNFSAKRNDLLEVFSPERQIRTNTRPRDTTPQSFSQKTSSRIYSDKGGSSPLHIQSGPIVPEGELDLEPGSMGALDVQMDSQGETSMTPPLISAKPDFHKTSAPAEEPLISGKPKKTRLAAIEVTGEAGGSITSLSPKTPLNLRNMFNEQIETLRSSQELKLKLQEPKSPLKAGKDEIEKSPFSTEKDKQREEEELRLNIQKKTDIITEEVFKILMEELGRELVRPGKESMSDKVRGLENAPPLVGLQNLIENNYFFTQGAEKHPGFQANVPMIPTGLIPEHERIIGHHNEVQDVYAEEVVQHVSLLKVETGAEEGIRPGVDVHGDIRYKGHEHDFMPQETDEDQVQHTESQADLYKILGIKTDLKAVESYLDVLMAEVKGTYMDEFLRNINIPIGLSVPEKLSNMHAYDLAGSESSLEMSAGLQQAILSIQLYLKIEEKLMDENPTKNEVSIELEHIHNKMIFDCLNEILDSYRPYSLIGEPYPWKTTIKSNKPVPITRQNVDKVIRKARVKVMEWAASVCGYYGERDEFIQDRTQSFAEDYLAQTREEKLSRMLAAEVHEMEDKWIAYDDEEAEVQLEIADLIFDKLVTETAELVIQINNERRGVRQIPKIPERPGLGEKKLKRKGSL